MTHPRQPPLFGRRIVIACGHFTPELGYQEVDLARAFTRLGAAVRVVTSTAVSLNARGIVTTGYRAGSTMIEGYEVVRLAPRLTVGANVLGCQAAPATVAFRPDHVILVGPGKLFGLDLLQAGPTAWRKLAIIQDNSEDGRFRRCPRWQKLPRRLVHRVLKRPAYRRVVRRADRVVLNVPETRSLVGSWLSPRDRELLSAKALELRLGYDPQEFYFDPEGREDWRSRYGVARDEILIGTCTRATRAKQLGDIIRAVSALRARGRPVRYVLAGLLEHDYSRTLRSLVADQPDPSVFSLLPVLSHKRMCELFSACDLGFWSQAAISIQQAMGTGLPVVLHDGPTVSHLVTEGTNGWYVASGEDPGNALSRAVESLSAGTLEERLERRKALAVLNRRYLSYDRIAEEMVSP